MSLIYTITHFSGAKLLIPIA